MPSDLHGHRDDQAIWYSLYQHGPHHKLSPHFRLIEFACRDGSDLVLVEPELVDGLEQLREQLTSTHGRTVAIHINSAYRTRSHNEAIGGADNSRHLWGLAADIVARGIHPDEVAELANVMGFGGVGLYDNFTHVDVGRASRRWDERRLAA